MNRRVIALSLVLLLAFSSLSLRIYLLSVKNIYSVSTTNTLKTNTIAVSRGIIYDRNLERITNAEEKYIACIKPTAKSFVEIERLLNKTEVETELKKGHLVTTTVPEADYFESSNDILTLTTYERYDGNSFSHIVGYCKNINGEYGIEKYYNGVLSKASGELSLKYHCDAVGRVLNGEPVEVYNDNYNNSSGVVLTIDKDIQKILENALINHNIDVGCGIVLDANTSEILACASLPVINRNNLEETFDVMENIYYAVTRKKINGTPEEGWIPSEKMSVDEAVKNDIAMAERLRITATTLDGILTVKGQGRRDK